MEISDVKRRVGETIERAKRRAAERRARADEASREYAAFLDRVAVPLFRQTANVLKAQGYPFNVFTPGGSVRLISEKQPEGYVELTLDTSGDEPAVMGRSGRARGRQVVESEHPIGAGPVRSLGEEEVLGFILKALEPLVER